MSLSSLSTQLSPPRGLSVEDYIAKAQSNFDKDDVGSAIMELTSAVDTLKSHQTLVEQSVDRAIATLSSRGGRADPPHPKALALVKLRMTLNAS